MQIGAVFPQIEIGPEPGEVRAWAAGVEDLGYRHALAYDHVLGANRASRPRWYGYDSETQFHEVFVLFGYLAAITQLELVTGVLVLPQRQTALVAKQAAEVAVLSGGRLRLGVGVGWNRVEYDALGESFTDRGARSEEQVELLRALWAEPAVTFAGRWHAVQDAGLNPLPPGGRIPVWFGGGADPLLRRVGRIGDGWFPQRGPDGEARRMLGVVAAAAEEAGRSMADVGVEPRLTLGDVPREGWADFVAGWRELGATHLCVNTMGMGLPEGAGPHVAALAEAMEVIRPAADG